MAHLIIGRDTAKWRRAHQLSVGAIEAANLAGLPHPRYSCVMRPLRYSINVTLDGCCDHRAIPADEELHSHAIENLNQADALLFGRVTYEMMERKSTRLNSSH